LSNQQTAGGAESGRAELVVDNPGLIAFTQALVRTRSVVDPVLGTTEAGAAEVVLAQMRQFGWEPLVEEVAPGRPNITAHVTGGGGDGPTMVFEGHTDVVTEGDRRDWTFDPFSGAIRDGRLHGRGSADMKSGLAAAIYGVRALELAGPFPGRVAVCALVDEEGMMLGAKRVAASGQLAGADGAVICEPEGGEICVTAKGAIRVRFDLHGAMAHGAMPHMGRNPVAAAGALLVALEQLQSHIRAEIGISEGIDAPSITPTVLVAGTATQINVIPSDAQVFVDVRTTPAIDHAGLLARLAELATSVSSPYGVTAALSVIDDRPAVEISPRHPMVMALAAAHLAVHGKPAVLGTVPGTTDGTILTRDAGVPTVVYGPGGKWIAHQADEFVLVDEIVQAAMVYALAAREFLSGSSQGLPHG
jgi:succinyl-diaminopimelate desuccinylase